MLRKGSSLESASSSQLGCEDGNGFPRNHDDTHLFQKQPLCLATHDA
jgi:hypothetical protein